MPGWCGRLLQSSTRNPLGDPQLFGVGGGAAVVQALALAGIAMGDVKAIKTHNPFAVNDIYFCREMGVKKEQMNNYGSSLIYGHPQGPTGMRLMIELVEELALLGGGYGLFDGCAAGDTAAAVVLRVS